MPIRTLRNWLWVGVAVLGLGLGGGALFFSQQQPETFSFGQGSYSLVDQNNSPVDQTVLHGHPSVLFFGFTHCPDVCPTTLAEISTWFEQLGEEGRDLRGYFVTVDPERDTPAILAEYV
ncbi:MAG: hypothetical protein JWP99_1763, partial [Devosia sp.]|nr:hypothetical protein [Devosia sp.]